MKATYIDYKDTRSFSKTLLDYLAADEKLTPFYGNKPDMDGFEAQMRLKESFAHRGLLAEVLSDQYSGLVEAGDPVAQNIHSLLDVNTFTVTTGHQLNIFTGPLYFIFKIATAIRLAKDLKQQFPAKNFVPVYWMATEDHDFEEINNTRVHGKKIVWDIPKVSGTGRMDTGSMEAVVRQYCNMLGLSENSSHLTALVEEAYLSGRSLADATRVLVHGLFKEYGLVIVDADSAKLKTVFAPIIAEDILQEKSFKAISETSQALEAQGYMPQVYARPCNFFYLTDAFRERIEKQEDHYEVLHQGLSFSSEELKQEIQHHPERFSPNVVMRPLYQELILPNLAYIGGGAEIVYWLQLKANFEQYGVPFPVLVPRNSALITEDSAVNKIYRLDLTLKSVFKSTLELQNEYVEAHTAHRLQLKDEWMELNAIFGKIKLRAHKIDPSLGPSTDAVKARLKKAVNNLEKKLLKADKRNHQDAMLQIERLKEKMFPGGGLQERTENFALLYVKYGESLVPDLVKHFDPLAFKFTILY